MKTRTMISILKVLNDIPYSEAMKELAALGNPKATVQRFGTGWRIGTMGWKSPEVEYQAVPVHKPQTDHPDVGVWFDADGRVEETPAYSPNNGNVIELGSLASLL